jgi:hypothetical protein
MKGPWRSQELELASPKVDVSMGLQALQRFCASRPPQTPFQQASSTQYQLLSEETFASSGLPCFFFQRDTAAIVWLA